MASHLDAAARDVRSTEAGHSPRHEILVGLSLFALALSGYLAFLTAHYSYDAVAGGVLLYQWMTTGDLTPLFHRYHVLHLPAAAGVQALLSRVGLDVDPLTLLQVLNALFGAGAVAVFYRLARTLEIDRAPAVMLTLLFGGGFSGWYYATNAEPYPPSLLFLLLAFLSAARAAEGASWARAAASGAWLGLAACFHGTCLLALPGLVVLRWPRGRERAGFFRIGATIVAAGVVFVAPYLIRYGMMQGTGPLAGLAGDRTALAREEGWSLVPHLLGQWLGLARSLSPTDWPSLPSSYPLLAWATQLALLVLTLLPLTLLFGTDRARRRVALALAAWAGVTVIFFSMYFPGSPKFASYQWAPLLLLAGLAIRSAARSKPLGTAGLVIVALVTGMTLVTSFDRIRRQTDPESNPHMARALAIARLTEPKDLVVHLGRGTNQYQKVYIPYFAVRRSLVLEQLVASTRGTADPSLRALRAQLAAAAAGPGRIVALADAVEDGADARAFERVYGLEEGSLARFFAAYRPVLLARDPAAGGMWLLGPPSAPVR